MGSLLGVKDEIKLSPKSILRRSVDSIKAAGIIPVRECVVRDPRRIDRILNKLRIIWEVQRWSRLGQLLMNLSRPANDGWTDKETMLWHREDTSWEYLIDLEIERLENGIECSDGEVRYLDRYMMVTKDQLIED